MAGEVFGRTGLIQILSQVKLLVFRVVHHSLIIPTKKTTFAGKPESSFHEPSFKSHKSTH